MTINQLKQAFFQLFHRMPDNAEQDKLIYMAQRRVPDQVVFDVPNDEGD